MITGVRGLCNGLGPACYGLIFYIFNVRGMDDIGKKGQDDLAAEANKPLVDDSILPGPPFLFGGCSVIFGESYLVPSLFNHFFSSYDRRPAAKET